MLENIARPRRWWLATAVAVAAIAVAAGLHVIVAQPNRQHFAQPVLIGEWTGKEGTLAVRAFKGQNPFVVRDETDSGGLAVDRKGHVFIDRDLLVGGNKKFVQPHPTDPEKLISYIALEGPEAGTYVRGTGDVERGEAVVELPEHFALVTAEAGLTVTLTPVGGWLQLYVAERSTRRLVVRDAGGRSGRFDYLVQGVRRGHEHHEVISRRS